MFQRTYPKTDHPKSAPAVTHRAISVAWRLALLLTLCLGLLPFTASAVGATAFSITVTTATDSNNPCATTGVAPCSLRDTVRFANTKAPNDATTITLPAGLYNLTQLGANEDAAATGDLDIHSNIILSGAGAATTIIDGQGNLVGSDRVFEIFANANVTMSGATIRNGNIANNGGGIYNHGGTLILINAVVTGSSGGHSGGGIYSSGALVITNTTISENTVTGISGYDSGIARGGGIFVANTLTTTDSKVLTNSAHGVDGGEALGGGIATTGATTLTTSAIQDNTATGGTIAPASGRGGGVYHIGSALTLTSTNIIANKATGGSGGGVGFGGGIAGENGALTITGGGIHVNIATGTNTYVASGGGINHDGGALTITDSALNGNVAIGDSADGGGLFISGAGSATVTGAMIGGNSALGNGGGAEGGGIIGYAPLTIVGSTLTGNSATDSLAYGGGVSQRQGNLNITNSTFNTNNATIAGGAIYATANGGTATVTNTTIADNSSGVTQAKGTLTLRNTIVAKSTVGNPNCSGTITDDGYNLDSGATCGFSGGKGSLSNTNPQLAPFDFYGTNKFKVYVLLPNSPAIDKIPANGNNCPAADQLGTARPQGIGCDMGAIEQATPPPDVTSIAPASGPATGGTAVTVTGYGFLNGATVTVGGKPCLSPAVVTISTITCVTPAGTLGPATVTVTNPGLPPGNTPGTLIGGFAYQPTVTVDKTGNGVVSGTAGSYPFGTTATFTSTPAPGNLFLGWTVDGVFVGFNPTLALPMTKNRMVVAAFAPITTFCDVTPQTPGYEAIINLAVRGIIKGQDGCFNPGEPLLRAQLAAMLARTFGWDAEDHGNTFSDQGPVDDTLWRNVGTLAAYGVAKGYADGTYDPTGTVLHAQAISFATRSMVTKGYWQAKADDPSLYPNVPATSGHRQDLATFAAYAGTVPGTTALDAPWDGPSGWDQAASRNYFARTLWQAYGSYFSVNHIP